MRDIRFDAQTHYANSYALVIGINHYQNASPLGYAVSDAASIRNLLVDFFGFSSENVTFLTDTEATKENILKSYFRFTKDDIALDDRILIFFAGHGHTVSGARGEVGLLISHDAKPSDLSTCIRWDDLTKNADLITAKHMLFIMDACYGGLAVNRSTPGSSRFLKDMHLRYSRQVITAGKADEVVSDSGGPLPDHSVFTGHLIEGLRGKAAGEGGVITAVNLMAYVYDKVANDKNSDQTPHYGYFDGDGDFIFTAPDLDELEAPENKDLDRLITVPKVSEPSAPVVAQSKVDQAKSLLSNENSAIQLQDLLSAEVRKFLAALESTNLSMDYAITVDELTRRMAIYENALGELPELLASIAHWGRPNHLNILSRSIARSTDYLQPLSGLTVWIELRWYPLIIELYSSGIAAIDANRYDSLREIFNSPVSFSQSGATPSSFAGMMGEGLLELTRTNVLKSIPGHEKNYTPLSEYLFKVLQPKCDEIFFLGNNYEPAFDKFEVFFALVVADHRLTSGKGLWGPVGRYGWKHRGGSQNSPLARVIAEAHSMGDAWPPLLAGLFGGRRDRFEKVALPWASEVAQYGWR